MKYYDKILFAIAILASVGGIAVYCGMKPSGKSGTVPESRLVGTSFEQWSDQSQYQPPEQWSSPYTDPTSGWNYDLFSVPEITWVTGLESYIAKEPPAVVAEKFGIKLVGIENPLFRLRVDTYSGEFPPAAVKGKRGQYYAFVSFVNTATKATAKINFSQIPGVKMTKTVKDDRTIVALTPRKPLPIVGQDASLKELLIVRGKSDSGDGTSYTRCLAVVIDKTDKNAIINLTEEVMRNRARIEAIFQNEENPSQQWRYTETFVADSETPEVDVAMRDAFDAPFKHVGTEASFNAGTTTYFVKGLDISAQEATMVKQSESKIKGKTKLTSKILTLQK